MKRSLLAITLGLILGAGTANAELLDSFSILNAGTNTFYTVDTLDWSSSGSGLAEGLVPGAPTLVGTNFTFDYQAFLAGATLSGGAVVGFNTGLNSTFEYTIVAKLQETVIDGSAGLLDPAIFSTLGGTWAIYESAPNAVVATGAGFDDGTLVAEGTINPGQISSFTTTTDPFTGIGSALLEGLINSINTAFLDDIGVGTGLPLFDFRFEGTQNLPPLDSTTTAFFLGGSATQYPTVTVGTDDTLFKVDGSNKFSVAIPEPSTMLLLGVGLLGLVGYSRKRANS
jgi:hypothetical protein